MCIGHAEVPAPTKVGVSHDRGSLRRGPSRL
jgi:hypothetical protein